MSKMILAGFLILVLLLILKAYLSTVLFRWNDRKNGTTKDTIAGRIENKIKGEGAPPGLAGKGMEFLKSYLFSYVTIFSYFAAYVPSQFIRRFLYQRVLGCSIGKDSCIHFGVRMLVPHRISIGNNCIIGESSFLDGRMFIEIGNNVNISTAVSIWTLQHDAFSPTFAIKGHAVEIGDNVWLSFRSTILPGVTVRKNCVIGAQALVTKSTNEAGIYFGVPAVEIRKRETEIQYKLVPMGFFY